jgi:hypothetical protein
LMNCTAMSPEGQAYGGLEAPQAPSRTAPAGPLGIHAKSASGVGWGGPGARVKRFCAQACAREVLPGMKRLQGCYRWLQGQRSTVDILYTPEHSDACYRGLQTCGSVWVCPVCAAKISERRRAELGQAIRAWESDWGTVLLVTYTIRHKRSDDLRASVDGLVNARKAMRSGRKAAEFKERFGLVGSVRALEVTHGVNGWHPHFHELLFVSASADLVELEECLRRRWAGVLKGCGMRDVNEHGIDVKATYGDVEDYVAKFGHERAGEWGPEHELAKTVVKRGRNGSRAPIDLLLDYVHKSDAQAGMLFQQYAAVFVGKRQLAWSRGLRALLLPDPEEKSDEEISEEIGDSYAILLATLSVADWRVILGQDLRGEVLDIARRGDRGELWDYLQSVGCHGPFLHAVHFGRPAAAISFRETSPARPGQV